MTVSYDKITMRGLLLVVLVCLCMAANAQPRLDRHGDWARIIVDDKPMLIIGGELGNSSASVPEDLSRIFPHLRQLGLNTVLAPVSWELIEAAEGEYDMSTVDDIIAYAQANDLKVVLLWFGVWKNSMSCYAPQWFKCDTRRFPRAHTADGKPVEEASALSPAVLDADCRAFCRLMEHLRDKDSRHTVIMIQVENEIGMIESPRDYSADATAMYDSQVPQRLTDYIDANRDALHPYLRERLASGKGRGTWREMFGDDIYGEEIFQTWTYADYVHQIARAGKDIKDLPMYVNVALNSRGRKPGEYPSGGPLAHLIDIWHCAAPEIEVLGVDIYDKGFADWTSKYHLSGNPLFIPEIRLDDKDAMYAMYAFGHHSAMGFCPFSIEDYPLRTCADSGDSQDVDLSADDQLNAYSSAASTLSPIASVYRLLRGAESLILARQGTADMDAVLLDDVVRQQSITTPDGVRINVRHSLSLGWEPASRDSVWPEAACIVLRLGEMDYLVIGSDVVLTFAPAESADSWSPGDAIIGIGKCEEVDIADGHISVKRHLNGDQTHQGRHVRIPCGQYGAQRVRLYKYR